MVDHRQGTIYSLLQELSQYIGTDTAHLVDMMVRGMYKCFSDYFFLMGMRTFLSETEKCERVVGDIRREKV